jgi:hypothetical protein
MMTLFGSYTRTIAKADCAALWARYLRCMSFRLPVSISTQGMDPAFSRSRLVCDQTGLSLFLILNTAGGKKR